MRRLARLVGLVKERVSRRVAAARRVLAALTWLTRFACLTNFATLPRGRRGNTRFVRLFRAFGFAVHAPAVVDAALLADARAVFFKLHRLDLDLGVDQFFNVAHQPRVAGSDKAHRQARGAGAAGAADAVHIVFGVERHVKVENRRHVFDVQTTGRNVGAHQQIDLALFEGLQRFQPLVLAFIAVQRGGLEAFALQRAGQPRATELAVDEHKSLLDTAGFENLVQGAALVVGAHTVEMLLDGRGRGVGAGHLDGDRVLQIARRQALDLGRESRREQQGDAFFGQVAQDALQVRQKADVQHAVGLVEHHVLDLVEHRVLGLNVVEQTTRRGHQHLDAFFELGRLRLHVHAAKHHGAAQVGVLGVQLDLLGHLVGQLACGQEHQRAHRVAGRRGRGVFVGHHALQQRQRKSGCFAGAGLGCAHHVFALQNNGNGLFLDGRHGLVAHFGHGTGNRLGQIEI